MKRFKKILVGVDLSWGDCAVADRLSEPNAEAVRHALWLAQLNSASIDFFFSLDLSVRAQQLISECGPDERTILDDAKDRLAELVAEAQQLGVKADSQVVIGKSWLVLIQQVLRKQHDLVLVGTRHLSAAKGHFVGSTGIKLLRKCPCAVWVTQPMAHEELDSILVAHDLRPVGDLAMELGCSLANLRNAHLHVVHAAEHPDIEYLLPANESAERRRAYRSDAEERIQSQIDEADLKLPAGVHCTIEPPDLAIMNCIERHEIDLLVMGTLGRAGISGFITGNTAERLLPQIPCSLLAVKPPGFKSPIAL